MEKPLTMDQPEMSDDLESNIEDLQNLIQRNDPYKASYMGNLAGLLQERFMRYGNLKDLETAISSLQEVKGIFSGAYGDQPDGAGNLAASYGNLGAAFLTRFQHLGTFEDLEDAIINLQKAVQLIPNDADLDQRHTKSGFLTDLGTAYQARFKRLDPPINKKEAFEDLKKAVEKANEVLNLAKKKGLSSPIKDAREDLETAEYTLKSLTEADQKALDDLENAVSTQKQAVEILKDDHKDKEKRLSNLANALLERFWRLKNREDLDNAISYHQQAVQQTEDGDPSMPNSINSLAGALKERFDIDGDLDDLKSIISNQEKVVQLTDNDDPNMTGRLTNLSIALEERFERIKDPKDLHEALSNAEKAAKHPPGSPRARFLAALQWGKCAELSSISPLPAFQLAINLLPRIAWLGIPFTDQRALLTDIGGAVHDAVAAAIRHHQYETAVEWAEHGRSIVWQNLLGLRTPLENLRVDHPELADKLQDISQHLRRLSPSDKSLNRRQETPITEISTYSRLAIRWDELVEEVRTLPGFEKFLQPKSFSELALAASEGPVIILNDHVSRGDALVLLHKNESDTVASVMHIPLEDFKSDTSKRMLVELNRLLMEARVRSLAYRVPQNGEDAHNTEFRGILTELWEHVVEPVIKGLGWKSNTEILPRIWWCGTGSFAFLPIHGAGDGEKKLTDYVVSSYTPTLSALLDQSTPAVLEDCQILAVAESPADNKIPKTEEEVKTVERLAQKVQVNCLRLVNEQATMESVLQEMKKRQWIHLACHGSQDLNDSMKSGFLLHDGEMLKLSEIIKQALPKADFAFLSACETAMGDEKLAEESIHLAAGMLFAGYRGVIGSMWSIGDDAAPVVVEEVYSRLLKNQRPNRKEAAFALHEAVKKLKAGGEPGANFVSWLPFIHIGR